VRRPYQTKTFKVEINFAAKVPMSAIGQVIRGEETENSLEALRVLDIILRQHSAEQYVAMHLHGLFIGRFEDLLQLDHGNFSHYLQRLPFG
jgi:eukaryotic translation initiation factor 2C